MENVFTKGILPILAIPCLLYTSKNGNRTFQVLEEDASIKTEDLTLKINSAGKYKQLEDYIPDDKNWRFLSVNVTIKNLFEHGAMLYLDSSDFSLTWNCLLYTSTALPPCTFPHLHGQ